MDDSKKLEFINSFATDFIPITDNKLIDIIYNCFKNDTPDKTVDNYTIYCYYGLYYEKKKDHSIALSYYLKANDLKESHTVKDHRVILHKLGTIYVLGLAGQKDYNKALAFYQKAADLGLGISLNNIGHIYLYNLKTNYSKAIEYFKKAIEYFKDDPKKTSIPLNNLGDCYYYGLGVSQNYKTAIDYFTRSYIIDHSPYSLFRIGLCHYEGHGYPKDTTIGLSMFKKAAEQKCICAMYRLGHYYEFVAEKSNMNFKTAIEYYEKAAALGSELAMARLAEYYITIQGLEEKAFSYIRYCNTEQRSKIMSSINMIQFVEELLCKIKSLESSIAVTVANKNLDIKRAN